MWFRSVTRARTLTRRSRMSAARPLAGEAYYITNPGRGFSVDRFVEAGLPATPRPKRTYNAFEFRLRRGLPPQLACRRRLRELQAARPLLGPGQLGRERAPHSQRQSRLRSLVSQLRLQGQPDRRAVGHRQNPSAQGPLDLYHAPWDMESRGLLPSHERNADQPDSRFGTRARLGEQPRQRRQKPGLDSDGLLPGSALPSLCGRDPDRSR